MLKIDCNGLNSFHEKISTTRSPDDRGEHEFSKVIAKNIQLQNHNIVIRMDDISPQERANFLLEGRRDEISLFIKFENLPEGYEEAGFFIRKAANDYNPDSFLMELIRNWFAAIPDLRDYTDNTSVNIGKPLLLPPRAVEIVRPARLEIVLCFWQAPEWVYGASPVRLKILGHHISRAINEFDARFNEIKELEPVKDSIMDELAEEVKPVKKTTRKKNPKT